MLAHNGFNLVNYSINRVAGFPIHINYMQTTAYCVEIAEYKKTHPGGWENIYHYSWLTLMILFPLIGFFLVRKRKEELSAGNWLGVFMLITPLYGSVQTIAERVFHALVNPYTDIVSSISIVLTAEFIIICILSLLIALIVYFRLLRKNEQIWLLLISLPVYVVTYYTWFFYWGRYIIPYHRPDV